MAKFITYIFSIALIIASSSIAYCQDSFLGLRSSTPIYMNPALAGDENYTAKVAIDFRNHYPAVGNGFVTYGVTADTYLNNYNSGLGIMIMRDQPGSNAYSYTNVMLAYSYHITLDRNSKLYAGLLGNFYYSAKDPSKLTFSDMIEGDGSVIENPDYYTKSNAIGIDFGVGGVYVLKRFMVGASVYHLGSKNDSSYHHRAMRFNIHAQMQIPLSGKPTYANPQSGMKATLKETVLIPQIYFWNQGSFSLTGVGFDLQVKNIGLGLFSRQDIKFQSFTFSGRVGFLASFMEVNYMFDIGRLGSNFRGLAATSHEIGVIFKFGEKED